jgi:hypothetical protein
MPLYCPIDNSIEDNKQHSLTHMTYSQVRFVNAVSSRDENNSPKYLTLLPTGVPEVITVSPTQVDIIPQGVDQLRVKTLQLTMTTSATVGNRFVQVSIIHKPTLTVVHFQRQEALTPAGTTGTTVLCNENPTLASTGCRQVYLVPVWLGEDYYMSVTLNSAQAGDSLAFIGGIAEITSHT